MPYTDFTVSADVCNRGMESASNVEVVFVLSQDEHISLEDELVATTTLHFLQPESCSKTQAVAFYDGYDAVRHVGAIVDPHDLIFEPDNDNNRAAGNRIGFGFAADLIVKEVATPLNARPFDPFAVTVKVCNQGQDQSSAVDIRLDLLPENDLNAPPALLTEHVVSGIHVGQCSEERLEVSTPFVEGRHVIRATVDPNQFHFELIDDNNDRLSEAVVLGFGPDLVITRFNHAPSALPTGPFESAITVCNQGVDASGSVDVAVVLSDDRQLSSADFIIHTVTFPPLDVENCHTIPTQSFTSMPQGAHTIGAIIDPDHVSFDLRPENNQFIGPRIGIGDGPDLVVTDVIAPIGGQTGGRIGDRYQQYETAVKICNQGQATSQGTINVDVLISSDEEFAPAQLKQGIVIGSGTADTALLRPGRCVAAMVTTGYIGTVGTYRIGAIVDPVAPGSNPILPTTQIGVHAELVEDNNVFFGPSLTFSPIADLVVDKIEVVDDPALREAQPDLFEVVATVCNQGQGEVYDQFLVAAVLSADADIGAQDDIIGAQQIPGLPAGECIAVSITSAGVSHFAGGITPTLGVVVDGDNIVDEFDDDNNARAFGPIGVGFGPDIIVTDVTAPDTVFFIEHPTLTATVCNRGQGFASDSQVQFVISDDDNIDLADHPVAIAFAPPIDAHTCIDVRVTDVFLDSPFGPNSTAFIGAIAILPPHNGETNPANNASPARPISLGEHPELTVLALVAPEVASNRDDFTAEVTVCNSGIQEVFAVDVEIIASRAPFADITSPTVAGGIIDSIAARSCATTTVEVRVPLDREGSYNLIALVNGEGHVPEINPHNNTTSTQIAIGEVGDLVVTAVHAPASAAIAGPLSADIQVCNQGFQPTENTSLTLHLSLSQTIDAGSILVGTAAVAALEPSQCATSTVAGHLDVGSMLGFLRQGRVFHLIATILPRDFSEEISYDNNTHADTPIVITPNADLVITELNAPDSIVPSDSFDVDVTVCNRGQLDLPFGADISVRLTNDLVPMAVDFTASLAVGACASQTVRVTHDPFTGSFTGDGIYTLIVEARPLFGEIQRADNTIEIPIAIAHAPDVVVDSVSGPASAQLGQSGEMEVVVCNRGNTDVYLVRVRAVAAILVDDDRLAQAIIGRGGHVLGEAELPMLGAAACQTIPVPVVFDASDEFRDNGLQVGGRYTLGAQVAFDFPEGEIRTDNNGAAGPDIAITAF